MSQIVENIRGSLAKLLNEAFFSPFKENQLRLFRGAVGVALIITSLSWVQSFRWFFAPDGYVPLSLAPSLGKYTVSWLHLFNYEALSGLPFLYAGYLLMLVAAGFLVIGKYEKYAAPVAYILLLSFLGRNPALSYGGTDVLQFLLLAVVLLSLPGKKQAEKWPIVLVQFQFAVLYLSAAISKMQVPEWFNGTKMFFGMSDPTFSYINPNFLLSVPALLAFITWYGFMSEIGFTFLIWSKGTRRFALAMVVLLHVGIALTMNVHLFSEVMLLGFTALLTESESTWLLERLRAAKTGVVSVVRRSKRKV